MWWQKSGEFRNNEELPPPSRREVDESFNKLRNNKSVGANGIPFNRGMHKLLQKLQV